MVGARLCRCLQFHETVCCCTAEEFVFFVSFTLKGLTTSLCIAGDSAEAQTLRR